LGICHPALDAGSSLDSRFHGSDRYPDALRRGVSFWEKVLAIGTFVAAFILLALFIKRKKHK